MTAFLRGLLDVASGRQPLINERRHLEHGHSQNKAQLRHARRHWIVRKEIGIARLSLAVAAVVVLGWVGWRIIVDTAAQSLATASPDIAVQWAPTESRALDQLTQQELVKQGGNIDAAEDWARRALRSNPMDERALFFLGAVAELRGDKKNAEVLMRMAGARTWRNLGTQLWLFENSIRRADYTDALSHADAMLRVEPAFLSQIFPTLAAFTTDPRGLRAVADFLATGPPWRDWFLRSISDRLFDKSHLDQLYSMLKVSQSPPTKPELNSYLNRLIKDGRFELAYRSWREALPPAQQAENGFPYNGRFEFPLDELPFNWVLRRVLGADTQIVPAGDARGNALRVQFSGARVDFANVEQLMLLPPGHYRLSGRVKADDLRTSRGLWWHVFCAAGPKTVLAHTDLVSGSLRWTDFSVEFDVPTDGCGSQKLQLQLPARIASEKRIEGQVWYQDLRITPAPAGAPG